MDLTTLQGLCDEFIKIADYTVHDDLKDVVKKMKAGDILNTKPREVKGVVQRILRAGLTRFQEGNPYTHVGLYAGEGKVIDSGFWKQRKGVVEIPIDEYAKRYSFRVLRPDATGAEKKDAVDYAKRQVGKGFNLKGMLRLALPTPEKDPGRNKRIRQEAEDALFCSQLIANAYPTVPFAKKKDVHHVRPVDIQRSTLTRTVTELR